MGLQRPTRKYFQYEKRYPAGEEREEPKRKYFGFNKRKYFGFN